MVRTQDEAQALAAKVRREHAAALAAREPEIDQAVVGNMGSFYRVRVGPFATQHDGQAACAKLKGAASIAWSLRNSVSRVCENRIFLMRCGPCGRAWPVQGLPPALPRHHLS